VFAVDPARKLMFNMAAKSGSMALAEMFLEHSGDLERWPGRRKQAIHEFRRQLLKSQGMGAGAVRELLLGPGRSDWVVIKFVRNPYSRAVSSYLHVVLHPLALFEPFEEIAAEPGDLSFLAFLRHVTVMDVWKANVHYRPQALPYEGDIDPPLDHIARIEDLADEVVAINRRFGTAFLMAEPREGRRRDTKAVATDEIAATVPFRRLAAGWPPYRQFYDEDTRALVEQIYAEDIARYPYSFDEV